MASNSASKKIYSPASSTIGYTLAASFNENSTDTGNNASNITATASLTSEKIAFGATTNYLRIYYYDNNNYQSGTLLNTKTVNSLDKLSTVSISGTINAPHKSDGTLSCYVKATWTKGSGNYVPASDEISTGWTSLTTIPRYFSSTPSISLASKTETTATFNWSTSETCNLVRYHLNGSSSGVDVFSGSSRSGSFTVTGLTANSTNTVYVECRREDSSLWSNSNSSTFETYDYPKPLSINDFVIGDGASVKVYNPLGRTYTLEILQQTTNTLLGTYTGSYAGIINADFKTEDAISKQYASIPNSKYGFYYAKVTYENIIKTSDFDIYSIDNTDGKCDPTFTVNDWSYVANLTNLTNNNQKVIDNEATITFTIDNQAAPKLSATIREYRYFWGNKYNSSGQTTVEKGNGNILQVIAIDSRGYSTSTKLNIDENLINYFTPIVTDNVTERLNGVETDTTLTVLGEFYNNVFGTNGVQNELTSAKYYVSTDNETWSTGYTIPTSNFVLNNNTYTLSDYQIHANGSSGGFAVGTKYYIKFELSDKINTITYSDIIVTDGKIAVDCFQDNYGNYHRGINGLADANDTLSVHGNISAEDSIKVKNSLGGSVSLDQATTSNNIMCTLPSHGGFIETRTTLYSNFSGTNGTVTLSDYPGNFDYLRIYYYVEGYFLQTMHDYFSYDGFVSEVETSNRFTHTLSTILYDYDGADSSIGTFLIVTKYYYINSLSLDIEDYEEYQMDFDLRTKDNKIFITRVEGIKVS